MRNVDILNELEKSHNLKELCKRGLIHPTLLWYRDLFFEYDSFRKMGIKSEESVRMVCDKIDIQRITVYRAIKSMRYE